MRPQATLLSGDRPSAGPIPLFKDSAVAETFLITLIPRHLRCEVGMALFKIPGTGAGGNGRTRGVTPVIPTKRWKRRLMNKKKMFKP